MKSNFKASEVKLSENIVKEIDELLDNIDVPVFGGHQVTGQ